MLKIHLFAAVLILSGEIGFCQQEGESCTVEHTNTLGVCTPAASCQSARRDYQSNGITPTFCSRSLQSITVCCSDASSILNTANNRKQPLPHQQTASKDGRRLSELKCEEYSKRVYETVGYIALVPDPETMSISAPKCDYNGVELIVGGEDADTGEFPHMAAIGWINLEGSYSFLCGGSLISSKFILTAAHCTKYSKMREPKPVIVRLGDQNLDTSVNDGASPIEVPIKNIIKHPLYKSPGKYHDIALLELASDVDFDSSIRPACLWYRPDFPGHTKAVATGWGVVDPRTQRASNELQKVSLTLLENDFCNVLLKTKRNRLWMDGFTADQLCAGELRGGKDTCQGDSGSPLQVVSRENKCVFHIVGITSFGHRCAQSGSPAVYTRVSSYLDWIESVVWPGEG
ncbi:serine protease snake-like isoform X1 [Danaus plexippus]|uniref:serine protease snake-like isoform X1 n=1 Tax=Danaus plexippus TaxID=13037 RepID=UPI002AB2A069|nr:serine protease snake-like isoform X1 [Danaus plexippus]